MKTTQTYTQQASFIQVINDIVSHMVYQGHGKENIMSYRFEKSILLDNPIIFENHPYHWIDVITFNPETRKMEYICSTDYGVVQNIPVNTQPPKILEKVHQEIILETSLEQVINEVVSTLKPEYGFYLFKESIPLEEPIIYQGKEYHQIRGVIYFKDRQELDYIFGESNEMKSLHWISIYAQPKILPKVLEQLKFEINS